MDLMIYILLTFVAGAIPFVEYMLAIPFGIIAGVPTIPATIIGFAGNLTTVILLIWFVDKVRDALRKKKKQKVTASDSVSDAPFTVYPNGEQLQNGVEAIIDDHVNKTTGTLKSNRAQKAKKLWVKYGMPGLSFLGTVLLSSHLTALMACSFGGNRGYITIWMAISLAIWSLIVGVAVHFGMDAFFR